MRPGHIPGLVLFSKQPGVRRAGFELVGGGRFQSVGEGDRAAQQVLGVGDGLINGHGRQRVISAAQSIKVAKLAQPLEELSPFPLAHFDP